MVATDSNCEGLVKREREIDKAGEGWPGKIVKAIPDPHVERWLLLDGAAFRHAVGRGCQAPDRKCERERYKDQLIDEIKEAGVIPSLGGIEYADDIVEALDLQRAGQDASLGRFLASLRQALLARVDQRIWPD